MTLTPIVMLNQPIGGNSLLKTVCKLSRTARQPAVATLFSLPAHPPTYAPAASPPQNLASRKRYTGFQKAGIGFRQAFPHSPSDPSFHGPACPQTTRPGRERAAPFLTETRSAIGTSAQHGQPETGQHHLTTTQPTHPHSRLTDPRQRPAPSHAPTFKNLLSSPLPAAAALAAALAILSSATPAQAQVETGWACPNTIRGSSHTTLSVANGTLNPTWTCLDIQASPNLTSLDLSDLGNLRELVIDGTALESLDLSSLGNLQMLWIGIWTGWKGEGNNALESLDLSGLRNLERLFISGNDALTRLDLPGLGSLWELDIDGTALESLDLSRLGNLSYLIINGNDALTSLNLSGLCSLKGLLISANNVLTDTNWAGLTLDTPDDERLRTPPYEIGTPGIGPPGEYQSELVPVNNSNVSCDQSSREEETPPTDADKESEEKITRADLNEEVITEEIISILTKMKPVLACEVFEELNNDLFEELNDDLCQLKKREANTDSEANTDQEVTGLDPW